jgi:hypothetical protein
MLNVFIQDASGAGLELFDYSITTGYQEDLIRGSLVMVTGIFSLYNSIPELTNFSYVVLGSGIDITDYCIESSVLGIDSLYVGTFASIQGSVTSIIASGSGNNLTIDDGQGNTMLARVWNATGLDFALIPINTSITIRGVISMYSDARWFFPAYQSDFIEGAALDTPNASPVTLKLDCFPNPFNPETTIRYSLSESGPVDVKLYNLRGQCVRSLQHENITAGEHTIIFNGTDDHGKGLASGVYFCRIRSEKGSTVHKMMLMK